MKLPAKRIGVTTSITSIDEPIEVDFYYRTAHLYTIDQSTYDQLFPEPELDEGLFAQKGIPVPPKKKRIRENGYLVIDYTYDMDPVDNHNQGAAKKRPELLTMHGIFSFFTNIPLTAFQFHSHHSRPTREHVCQPAKHKTLMKTENGDHSTDLQLLLNKLISLDTAKEQLIFSLLDRWRKALYLEKENEDGFLFTDEAILSCFHIWELLAKEFSKDYENTLQDKVDSFIENFLTEDLFIREQQRASEQSRLRSVFTAGIAPSVGIKAKIFYLFKRLDLYNNKSHSLVERFLEFRNMIAHGRSSLYEPKAIFPLKPFFSLVRDEDEVEFIKIATARTIAAFLGLKIWEAEWDYILRRELPTLFEVKRFIKNKIYEQLSITDFLMGKEAEVTPYVVTHYFLEKKISLSDYEATLSNFLLTSEPSAENVPAILYPAVVLADSKNDLLSKKCRDMVTFIRQKKWEEQFNYRDILKYLDYLNMTPKWYHSLLNDTPN